MGVIQMGDVLVHGNFAEVLPEKPKDFDYMSDAKWLEPYDLEWREVLGNAICSCTTVQVNFAPYYGFDHFHQDTCSLMRKLRAEPQINNLREISLPTMTQYNDSLPNDGKLHIWVEDKTKRSTKVKVKAYPPQLSLI